MEIMITAIFAVMLAFAVKAIMASFKKRMSGLPVVNVNDEVLEQRISFYRRLDSTGRLRFKNEVVSFLQRVSITPINTTITDTDRMLVAASAVIPVFALEGWTYPFLEEVLVYNDHFNSEFQSSGDEYRNIMGLVGTGAYKNKMLLSKSALHAGFGNEPDQSNTAIHEFVHLIDGADGVTDGVPRILMEKEDVQPWIELMHTEMEKMKEEEADFNPYGYTSKTEFFAVASEYFFESPEIFKEKHPVLFDMMQKAFRTK
ncbi:MAG: zinc-dependent peptidase [Ferruginibacter sp.]